MNNKYQTCRRLWQAATVTMGQLKDRTAASTFVAWKVRLSSLFCRCCQLYKVIFFYHGNIAVTFDESLSCVHVFESRRLSRSWPGWCLFIDSRVGASGATRPGRHLFWKDSFVRHISLFYVQSTTLVLSWKKRKFPIKIRTSPFSVKKGTALKKPSPPGLWFRPFYFNKCITCIFLPFFFFFTFMAFNTTITLPACFVGALVTQQFCHE